MKGLYKLFMKVILVLLKTFLLDKLNLSLPIIHSIQSLAIELFKFKVAATNMKYFAGSKFLMSSVHKKFFDLIWQVAFKLEYFVCQGNYNHLHNILRLFDVLPNFSFTTSETNCSYYL